MTAKKEMGRTSMPKKKAKTRLDVSSTGRLRAKQMTKRKASKATAKARVAGQKAKRKAKSAKNKLKAWMK